MPRLTPRLRAVAAVLTTAALTALVPAAAGAAPAPRANLVVPAGVTSPPSSIVENATFRAGASVRNASGRVAAPPTTLRYYLTRNVRVSLAERQRSTAHPRGALADVLLVGARAVPRLAPGAAAHTPASARTVLRVPSGTPAGRYFLLACADDRGAVLEQAEHDNCRAAGGAVLVRASTRPTRIDAASDTLPTSAAADYATTQALAGLTTADACAPTRAARVPSLAASLRSTNAWLAAKAGSAGMTKFRRSADYGSALRLQKAAGAAIVSGNPGAALAALLRAHQLQPRNPAHLESAAAVAVTVGRPLDALAMLDAAAKLDDPGRPAMGISRHAAQLTTRGSALVALGQLGAAERVLHAARASDATLTEPLAGLATIKLCSTLKRSAGAGAGAARTAQSAAAAQALFEQSMRRQVIPGRHGGMDISQGISTPMRAVPMFPSASTAEQYNGLYQSIFSAEQGRQTANMNERWTLRQKVSARTVLAVERRLRAGVAFPFSFDFVDPEVKAIAQSYYTAMSAVSAVHSKGNDDVHESGEIAHDACEGLGDGYDECYDARYVGECRPRLTSRHTEWLAAMRRAQTFAGRHVALTTLRGSGVAANFAEPNAHAWAMTHVKAADSYFVSSIAQSALYWSATIVNAHCFVDPPAGGTGEAPGSFGPKSKGACPGPLKAINAVFDLGVTKVKATCEKVSTDGDTGGWLSAFGEIEYAYSGQVTIFAGAKAGTSVPGLNAGADFKSGIYVVADKNGIVDIGWRVGPSMTVGAGPVEFAPSNTIDMSFLPSTPPTSIPRYPDPF